MNRILNVYKFLKEYNNIKNPQLLDYKNSNYFFEFKKMPKSNFIKVGKANDDFLLKVTKPKFAEYPRVPEILSGWLLDFNEKSEVSENLIQEFVLDSHNNEIYFTDNDQRVAAFDNWLIQFKQWQFMNNEDLLVKRIYGEIFDLFSTINAEVDKYELVLGVGILKYFSDMLKINYPLVTQRVELSFEVDSFVFRLIDVNLDFSSGILRLIDGVSPQILNEIAQTVEDSDIEIEVENSLGSIISSVSDLINSTPFVTDRIYNIFDEKVLILKPRSIGYARFIEKIIEDIEESDDVEIPSYLNQLVNPSETETSEQMYLDEHFDGLDENSLLTLPTNEEQLRILKTLSSSGSVLVQGPPGTGKTHTIANLIGHLLSEGKSILVTAQNEKALSILKDKVHKSDHADLQSLCISVNRERSQRLEMDDAINALTKYMSENTVDDANNTIKVLEQERSILFNELNDAKKRLLEIRRSSLTRIIYGELSLSLIEAAKYIGENRSDLHDLRLTSTNTQVKFPLSQSDMERLLYLNNNIDTEDVHVLSVDQEKFSDFWSIDQFKNTLETINELSSIDFNQYNLNETYESSKNIHSQIKSILNDRDFLVNNTKAVELCFTDLNAATLLVEGLERGRKLIKDFEKIDYDIKRFNIRINENLINKSVIAKLQRLNRSIDPNIDKPIDTFTKRVMYRDVFELFSSDSPITNGVLKTVELVLLYQKQKSEVISLVKRLGSKIDEIKNLTNDSFEYYDFDFKELMNVLMYVNEKIIVFINSLLKSDFTSKFPRANEISCKQVIDYFDGKDEYFKFLQMRDKLNEAVDNYINFANRISEYASYSENYNKLVSAVKSKSIDQYIEHYSIISSILEKKERLSEFNSLLKVVDDISPLLATRLRNKNYPYNTNKLIDTFYELWKYSQIHQQLDQVENRNTRDFASVISDVSNSILKNSQKLAHHKAWLKSRVKQTQRMTQDLHVWREANLKMPKSRTAKSSYRYRRVLQELTPKCQEAIPVWIMSIPQLIDIYDPRKNKFDVIIIDEASQADMLALSVLYLGKKVIIVGDNKQVSPDAIGVLEDRLSGIQNQYLSDYSFKDVLSPNTSIYDLASFANFRQIMLLEHFRSVPEIIRFNNFLFYNNRIKPLRNSHGVEITDFVKSIYTGGHRERNINEIEADQLVTWLSKALIDERYRNKTFGIISMFGSDQIRYIRSILQERIDLSIIQERKISVGNAYQFQGDERDVVLISLVDDETSIFARNYDGGINNINKSYNVATSRAKDQLVIFHSFKTLSKFSKDDLRYKLLSFAEDPSDFVKESTLGKAESEFEKEVLTYLLQRSYNVIPQYKVGNYRIDIVVEHGVEKVAIECDGEAYHTDENFEDDFKRQMLLRRLGWRFIRIRGRDFYMNKDQTMYDVFKKLSNLQIFPNGKNIEKMDFQLNQKTSEDPFNDGFSTERTSILEDNNEKTSNQESSTHQTTDNYFSEENIHDLIESNSQNQETFNRLTHETSEIMKYSLTLTDELKKRLSITGRAKIEIDNYFKS